MSSLNRPRQITLINMGGKGNIGDRAMALNIVRQFRERFPSSAILVGPHTLDFMVEEFALTRYPFLSTCLSRFMGIRARLARSRSGLAFEALYYAASIAFVALLIVLRRYFGVRLKRSFMEQDLAKAIADADVVFFCGGGYINDVGSFDSRTNLVMAWLGVIARRPVIMSGQGLGPFHTDLSRWLLKQVVPRLTLITFRDTYRSEQLLGCLSIQVPAGSTACGDDAMSLPLPVLTPPEAQVQRRKVLGVNLRLSPFTHKLDQKVGVLAEYLSKVAALPDWRVEFFIFETWRPWEEMLLADLLVKTGIKNYGVNKTEDPREALWWTKRCTVTIGVSYHFIVFSLRLGIPSIAIYSGDYYRSKMLGLLGWYGKENWALSAESLDADQLLATTVDLAEVTASDRHALERRTLELAERCDLTIKTVSQLIGRS